MECNVSVSFDEYRKKDLANQGFEVEYKGSKVNVRESTIFLRGVNHISTVELSNYVDYWLNYEKVGKDNIEYVPLAVHDQIRYKIEWIDDSSVNLLLKNQKQTEKVIERLSKTSLDVRSEGAPADIWHNKENDCFYLLSEIEAKDYLETSEFQRRQNMSKRIIISDPVENSLLNSNKDDNMNIDSGEEWSIDRKTIFYIRQSFLIDKKVKNARIYSRYYLLNGEPQRRLKKFKRRRQKAYR